MNVLEDFQLEIVDIKQRKIKGDCKKGLLRNRHILMRFSLIEDFINMMSKNVYYIIAKERVAYKIYTTLIYDAKFKPDKETTQAMAWIYFLIFFPPFS
ncbi:hypothetical protein H5410_060841 [Solanum commersonii]|uniref:DUF4283 domain-containing protein n=1 Tax=Solanum commersonii TaxID=4109 RepID=A0A9J5W645_SOLCO|nr:hypothetical protein H5410_060841 [Solanum commersonii]